MRVILTGLPYFAKKISQQLAEFDPKNHYIALNSSALIMDKLKFFFLIFFSQTYYIHGGAVNASKTLDLALLLNKKIIMNWAGTDVLKATEIVKAGLANPKYIKNIQHYCVAPWLKEELAEIGIDATILDVTALDTKPKVAASITKDFTILTYIGKGREVFYGIESITDLAVKMPNITIRIAGIDDYPDLPKNITTLGWVDMQAEFENCNLFIRNAQHDGMPFTVIEALSHAKHVIFNQKFEHTQYINNDTELLKKVTTLVKKHQNQQLVPNIKGQEYVIGRFNNKKILTNLVDIFNMSVRNV